MDSVASCRLAGLHVLVGQILSKIDGILDVDLQGCCEVRNLPAEMHAYAKAHKVVTASHLGFGL